MTNAELVQSVDEELAECARIVNNAHAGLQVAAESFLRNNVGAALTAGEALIRAKKLIPPHRRGRAGGIGQTSWGRWVAENLTISDVMARKYVRLAYHKADVIQWLAGGDGRPREVNIKRALEHIASLPYAAVERDTLLTSANAREARKLRAQGLSQRDIAERMGLKNHNISYLLDPERARKTRRASARRMRAAKGALRREERGQLVRAKGGSLARAYGDVRRLEQELDTALAEASTEEVRGQIRDAIAAAHRVEDALVRASRAAYDEKESE